MRSLLIALILLPAAAWAQAPVPQSHVPPSVLMELQALQTQFDIALNSDCASERCFSKGCVYREHASVDKARNGSLPGLGETSGPGAVPVQDYLTLARCEFTHEKSIPTKEIQTLVRRLEQRLSKGWLRVSVGRTPLEPLSEELKTAPAPPPLPAVAAPPPAVEKTPAAPESFSAGVALRELWVSLLPHFAWMIALVMTTLAVLLLIWAGRRLGKETLEEKALAAQLLQEKTQEAAPTEETAEESATELVAGLPMSEELQSMAFVESQRQLWTERVAQSEFHKEQDVLVDLMREWLRAGEFALMAKAIFVFGDKLAVAFSSDGELAMRKVELAEYLRDVDSKTLPSDAEFFRKLNQHAIASSLMTQSDAEIYRSLREEFGPASLGKLMEALSPRHGALLFAMVPADLQHELTRLLSPVQRIQAAGELLISNRSSKEEMSYLLSCLSAARMGTPIPPEPKNLGAIGDRGREFDAAGALSALLPTLEPTDREKLFAAALKRFAGTVPAWYENILFGDMLLKVPDELRSDLLLEVDVKGLAGWSSVQQPSFQASFLPRLMPAMQSAVRSSMSFGSRADQFRLARRGHDELVAALKRQMARGKVSFTQLVA